MPNLNCLDMHKHYCKVIRAKHQLEQSDFNFLFKYQLLNLHNSIRNVKLDNETLLGEYSTLKVKRKSNTPKPFEFWKNKENIKQFLLEIKEKLNLKTPEDWNSITKEKIRQHGGNGLIKKYALFDIKLLACPEGKNVFSNIKKKPDKYWENEENIKQFLLEIKDKLNLKKPEDWNSITKKQILKLGGRSLFLKFSLFDIKLMGCPENKFIINKKRHKAGYWDDINNVKEFLHFFGEKLNLKSFNDWNSITSKQIHLYGGSSLLLKYSLFDLKSFGFPNGNFDKQTKPPGFWNEKENIINFLDDLKAYYQLKTFEDWNSLSYDQICKFGGSSLLKKYSLFELKCLAYPDSNFNFNQRNTKSLGYWNDDDNIQLFLSNLKDNFNLNSSQDWKRLSKQQIISFGGSGLLSKYSLAKIIQMGNPDSSSFDKKSKFRRSSQRWLFLQIQKLFPGEEIVEDYFHSEVSRESGFAVQFDVFLVSRNIAIEYQGKQHYEDIPANFAPLEMYKYRDDEKERICKDFGIQLIIIPYWWDNHIDSLKETINSKVSL